MGEGDKGVSKKSSDEKSLLGCVLFVLEPKLLRVLIGEQYRMYKEHENQRIIV